MRKLSIAIIGALTLLAPLSAKAEEKSAGAAIEVHIDNFAFTPPEVTVPPGTKITWTNRDDIPHTVTASGKAFRSKVLDTDQSFSFEMTTPGEYEYFCSLHPHMKGKVIVK